jgi:5-methyltetrahydrofolate--homocysteine methyltransferase
LIDYVQATRSRVVIYDGAMGTSFQQADLGEDDFGGADLEGSRSTPMAMT